MTPVPRITCEICPGLLPPFFRIAHGGGRRPAMSYMSCRQTMTLCSRVTRRAPSPAAEPRLLERSSFATFFYILNRLCYHADKHAQPKMVES